ncbi:MAG: hypothetical protein E6G03_15245 [Actinobacteria bacterium]|nr:MAG: hypothetical protein E6G03_15245 [Actinomycetota bacterium]
MPRKLRMLLAAAGVVALTAATAGASTTSVTITSPRAGQSISLKKNPYLAIAGGATFAPTTAGTTRLYLRRDGCGTSNDNPHLSIATGTDGGDGCGLIFNAVVGTGGDVDQGAFVDFPSSDGMPLALSTAGPITGQVSLTGAQVGLAYVDVTLEALINGEAVTLGKATGSATLDPTGDYTPVPFSIQPSSTLDGSDLQALDLRVLVHGPNVYSGFVSLNGHSFADLPSHAASVNESVQVSLDDSSFANAVPARLSGSSWSVALQTPAALGKHTIYARSAQGFDTSATASQTFTVTK